MTLAEAWPGRTRANQGNPVHLVDWPPGRSFGSALCGRALTDVELYEVGWAEHVHVGRCSRCDERLLERARGATAQVIPLSGVRARRRR